MTKEDYFYHIKNLKEHLTVDDYCSSDIAKSLKPFMEEVWRL